MIIVGGELATRSDDTDQAKNEGEDPAGSAPKAMATAYNHREEKRGKVDSELGNRDAASCIQLHGRREVAVIESLTLDDTIQIMGKWMWRIGML